MKGTLQKETQAPEQTRFVAPEVNIFETRDGYVLEAEMPGVPREGLELTLEGNEITIVGRKRHEPVAGEILMRESTEANFKRVFELDPAIDTSRISARMDQGVLTLTLPKSEKVKPRRIQVEG